MGGAPRARTRARACMAVGLAVHGAAQVGFFLRLEPALAWRYELVWWSYIAFASGWVHLRTGRSLFLDRPRAFALLCAWSAVFWIAFEGLNLVLANWYYVGLPPGTLTRWCSAYLSFATVLPGLFVTADLLRSFGLFEGARCRPFAPTAARRRLVLGLGLVSLGAPLVAPRYAFPLVWGALVLLVEPWLVARGRRCLWSQLAAGRPGVPLRLLAAGLVAGLLWEAWNAGARARWIYTVPFLEELKLFEMPLLGFLGFPPFALEAYSFACLLAALGWIPDWEPEPGAGSAPGRDVRRGAGLIALAGLLLAAPLVQAMLVHTVRGSATRARDLPLVDERYAERLERAGLGRGEDLARAGLERLEELVGAELADPLLSQARLAQVRGMGTRGVAWLASIGVRSAPELARRDPGELIRLLASGQGPRPPPSPAEVRVWWRGALRVAQASQGAQEG